jgi:biotin operon repressor|nr:MAG TPA: helix-turn-helix domain protein [Caudoviricetes sp.]
MDTYALQRVILKMDLLPGERYVGMVLALHLNQKTGTIQVRQKTLIEETGYSRNTVQKALQRLIASGVFISQQTGRAAVLALGNNTGNMDTPNTGHQLPQKLGYRRKWKGASFDLDTSLSTRVEEQNKRDEKRFQREQK